MNTKNSKTTEPRRLKYNLIDKLDLNNPNKNMALASLSIYYTWKNVKSIYNNNKVKIFTSTWNDTFDLPDESYNISEIQDYIKYIIKKHETIAETAPVLIYANIISNRIVFKIKTGYKLELFDCNGTRTHNHLFRKRTLNHLAKLASLAKWLSVRLRTKCLWVRVPLQSLNLQIWHLLRVRSSLTFRQL